MGGDHKCPVCQATFTRPQHVARHMRSHTGDRPYKCQFCGDQFARSDLLSRHINKCHANEKPVPVQGRRKGSASASRATTSKQACDQCVQSSLPCDGSNPCVKCVQRKCRCTYVKFHRQTAPVGPGHNPRPTLPIIPPGSAAMPSSRLPLSYPSDDFFLQPPPSGTMADHYYSSHPFSFPSLYAEPASNQDFTAKYRAQAEMLRNNAAVAAVSGNAHFAPAGGGGTVGPGVSPISPSHMYNDPRSASGASSWVSWGQEPSNAYHQQDPLHDKDIHRGHDPLSHRSQHPSYMNNTGFPQALQQTSSSGAGIYSHHQLQSSAPHLRRGSVDFGSSSEGSHESPTTAEHSIPSSASSSNVHLPLDNLTMQQPHSLPYNALENLSDHHPNFSAQVATTSRHDQVNGLQHSAFKCGEPVSSSMYLHDPDLRTGLANANATASAGGDGATSFFPGMMSLEGGDGISSLSQVPADDPDATPMPLKENPPPTVSLSAPPVAMTLPIRSSSAGRITAEAVGGNNMIIHQNNSGEPKEFRDFWKQYVRTPLSGPDAGVPISSPSSMGGGLMSPPGMGYRRQRVASMPSSKTPTIAMSLQSAHLQQHQQRQNDRVAGGGESGVRTTLHEDLKSYEAAVMARKAPTTLNLVPKNRRGTVPALPPSPSSGTGFGGVQGVGVPLPIKFDTLLHDHQQQFQYSPQDARPSSSLTDESGSSGDGGPSFSFAGAYMRHQQYPPLSLPQGQQSGPHLSGSKFMIRRGSPSTSSTSTTGESSSRASSVAATDEAVDDRDGNSDDGYGAGVGGGSRRPSYKRLASTTLTPVKAKRRASESLKVGMNGLSPTMAMGDGGEDVLESPTSDVAQSFASGALGIH